MERGGEPRDGEEKGEDCGRGSWEHSYKWIKAGVPEGKSATPSTSLIQGHGWEGGVFIIKVEVVAGHGGEGKGGVTLEQLGLRQEKNCRVVELGKMGEGLRTSPGPFNIPQYYC